MYFSHSLLRNRTFSIVTPMCLLVEIARTIIMGTYILESLTSVKLCDSLGQDRRILIHHQKLHP